MIDFLKSIDTEVFLFFNGLHHSAFDEGVKMFSDRFIWVPMYASILFILLRSCHWKQVIVYTIAIALAITLTDQTCATLIRPLCERLRPANLDNPLSEFVHIVNGYRGGRYGFPSCHAANSFALACFLACLIRNRRFVVFIFGWAILNSYSRLYLGVHYPGDLLVGGLIGAFYGWLCYRIGRRFDPVPRKEFTRRFTAPVLTIPTRIHWGWAIRVETTTIAVSDIMIGMFFLTLLYIIVSSVIS